MKKLALIEIRTKKIKKNGKKKIKNTTVKHVHGKC
jgi:hypothetical protein